MTDLTPAAVAAATHAPSAEVHANWPLILDAMHRRGIASLPSQKCMAATVKIETGAFRPVTENLNYSADGLMQQWKKRFPTKDFAQDFHRQPEKIANYVYAGRNGNVDPGDGWKYRGRGEIQTTGRANYAAAGQAIGMDLLTDPDDALKPLIAAELAAYFWDAHGIAAVAEAGDLEEVRRRVNGGLTHYADFKAIVERFAP